MSKIETVKRLIEQESRQIDELRNLQNKTLPELTATLKPIASSMATLTDQTAKALKEAEKAFESQAQESRQRQWALLENVEQTINHLKDETEKTIKNLSREIDETKTSIRNWSLKTWIAILIVGLIAATPSIYLTWRLQGTPSPKVMAMAVEAMDQNRKWFQMYQESPEKTQAWIKAWWEKAETGQQTP